MSDVGDVAQAVTAVAHVAYEILHKTQRELIDEVYAKTKRDIEDFRDALLAAVDAKDERDRVLCRARIQLKLDGLLRVVRADLCASDLERLRSVPLGDEFDLYDLLGLYQIGKGAEFAQRMSEIILTEK